MFNEERNKNSTVTRRSRSEANIATCSEVSSAANCAQRNSKTDTLKALREQKLKRSKLEKKQDQKAAKILSAILLAFVVTWTPYNINVVLMAFCHNCLDNFDVWISFGKKCLILTIRKSFFNLNKYVANISPSFYSLKQQ